MHFMHCISDRISGLLVRFNLRTVHIPPERTTHLLRQMKDDLGLKVPGIYINPYKCFTMYVEQRGCAIEVRYKEHAQHIHLYQLAVAEHSIEAGHRINLKDTTVFARMAGYV
jgi:hypothetical protein